MASVFFMQPLGQIAGNVVSLIVIAIGRNSNEAALTRNIDSMWRWVLGIGVIPGAIATLFRFAIPESPRYLVEIDDDPVTAEFDATTLFSEPQVSPGFDPQGFGTITSITGSGSAIQLPPISSLASSSIHEDEDFSSLPPATLNSHWRLAKSDIIRYFWTEGNWRSLAGTSLTWLLMDFGFYGISLASPQFLAKTWGQLFISESEPYWMTDSRPGADIYDMFFQTSIRALVILNVGSFVGGLLLIIFAHRIERVALQKYTFLGLSVLFVALGSIFVCLINNPAASVTLYVIGQILFNFGGYITLHKITQLTSPRPQRNNLHGPRRNISHSLQSNMLRPQRRLRKTRLHPCPNLLHILSLRRRSRRRLNSPSRHRPLCF